MKIKTIITFVVLTLITAFTISAQDTTGTAITSKKFERKIKKKNAVLLDVRTPAEYNESCIPGSKHYDVLDSLQFVQSVQTLDKNKKYFLYCKSGRRSGKALVMMKNMGFENVLHLKGGITAWQGKKETPKK